MKIIQAIRAFVLRNLYRSVVVTLEKHPILKGKLFQRIKIKNEMYYHVAGYKVLKSKNQNQEI